MGVLPGKPHCTEEFGCDTYTKLLLVVAVHFLCQFFCHESCDSYNVT